MGNLAAGSRECFDVVLDLDGTLICMSYAHPEPDFLLRNGESDHMVPYVMAPGAVPFLEALLSIPECRISFFSAGDKIRNEEVVAKLMEKVYASLRARSREKSSTTAFWHHHIQVLSREEVDELGRKDIRKLHRTLSLDRAVLVDDGDTSDIGQEGNLIRLHPGLSVKRNPKMSQLEASLIHNNLVFALGKVLFCINKWKASRHSVQDSLRELRQSQRVASPVENESLAHEHDNRKAFYELGLREMRKFDPSFHLLSES